MSIPQATPKSIPHSIAFPVAMYQEIRRRANEQERSFNWIVLRELEKIFIPQEQSQQEEPSTK